MNDLLKKLNTLVNATINDLTPNLPRFERTPDLDRRVRELRERINAALEHEDQLQSAAQSLRAEVARLDALADEALAKGQDAEARHIMQQLQRAEQRLSFAESDLKMHQRSAEELIQNVNMLEAAVADKKHSDQTAATASKVEDTDTKPLNPAEAYAKPPRDAAHQQAAVTENAIEKISTIIKDAQDRTRERITALGDLLHARDETPLTRPPDLTKTASPAPTTSTALPADDPAFTVSDSSITNRPKKTDDDDELAQRLRRLSKPE